MMGGTPQELVDDDFLFDDEEDEESDDFAECGRWNGGHLTHQCRLAGTEWCDWDCPIGTPRSKTAKE